MKRAHLLDRAVGGRELVLVGHVDPVEARGDDGRRGDAHVHLGRARVEEHLRRAGASCSRGRSSRRPRRSACPSTSSSGLNFIRIPCSRIALIRLDERARDVAVLDERLVERDPGAPSRSRSRRACRESATPMTRSASAGASRASRSPIRTRAPCTSTPPTPRVRPREVDVLEDAERVLAGGNRLRGVQAVVVDPDDLARTHVAHDVGADEVERAGLGRDDPVVADLPERERTEAERVAERDERVVDERGHRVRALEPAHRVRDRLDERGRIARDQRGDDLRVGARARAARRRRSARHAAPRRSRGSRCGRARPCVHARGGSAAARSPSGSRRSSSSACGRSRPRPGAPAAAAR